MSEASDTVSLAPFQEAFAQMAMGAVVVPHGVTTTLRLRAHEASQVARFEHYRLAHRGRFAYSDGPLDPELLAQLVYTAEKVADCSLVVTGQSLLRLAAGDYMLSACDPADTGFEPSMTAHAGVRQIDVIADLSDHSSGEAQIVYAYRGEHFFAVPQLSRSVAVVERRASVTRYHRYLNHTMIGSTVLRCCLTLHKSDVARTDPPLPTPAVQPPASSR